MLARVFEDVDLRLAVGAEGDWDSEARGGVGGENAVAEVALGGRTGANG
jgi:hypothetical protein